jgi:hypothetical protein
MNWSAVVTWLVPPPAVTVTSTVPLPGGAIAVIWVELSSVKLAAGVPPKLTLLAPSKFSPVIVT